MIAGLGGLYLRDGLCQRRMVQQRASVTAAGSRSRWLSSPCGVRTSAYIRIDPLRRTVHPSHVHPGRAWNLAVKELYKMLPYVITILVRSLFPCRKSGRRSPRKSGLSYFREEREREHSTGALRSGRNADRSGAGHPAAASAMRWKKPAVRSARSRATISTSARSSFEVYANATPEDRRRSFSAITASAFRPSVFLKTWYIRAFRNCCAIVKASGVRIAVATGKPTVFSEQILEHFGLRQYIDVVSGIPLDREPPDKCEVIQHALYEMGISDRLRLRHGRRPVTRRHRCEKWRGSRLHRRALRLSAAAKSWKPKEPTPSQTALQRCEARLFS